VDRLIHSRRVPVVDSLQVRDRCGMSSARVIPESYWTIPLLCERVQQNILAKAGLCSSS